MYNVSISLSVRRKVDLYTDSIRDYYIDLYSDTGLGHAEEMIQSQYIEAAKTLNFSLLEKVQDVFSHELIPYAPIDGGSREVSIRLGSRRLFLIYEEDPETMTRYITDIEILRK